MACVFLLRQALDPILPDRYPYLLSFAAILLCANLFDRGSGILATGLAAAFAAYFYLPPIYSLAVEMPSDLTSLVFFVATGMAMSLAIEAMHRALAAARRGQAELQQANASLAQSERARVLLLHEFRHRIRNDLAGLVALLLLRARSAPSEAAREGLREAAEHAMALARIHTRLSPKLERDGDDGTSVNTQDFITSLCADIELALAGDGLRPVAVVVEAEPHTLEAVSERFRHDGDSGVDGRGGS